MKADLHVHSNFSYDVPNLPEFSPRALYDRAVNRGMAFFTLTDHDTLAGIEDLQRSLQATYGDHPPIPVIPGVEMKLFDPSIGHTIHVNVLGLSPQDHERLEQRRSSLPRFTRYCRRHGLFHTYNHPLWFERGERPRIEEVERAVDFFPVIELNAGRIPELNARTAALARRHGKPLIANSDTHVGQVGKCYTQAKAQSVEEFLACAVAGKAQTFPDHFRFQEFTREISEAVDLWTRKRPAPAKRRALPHGHKDRYLLVHRILGRRPMRWPIPRRLLGVVMKVIARATTYLFLRQQRRMNLRLGEAQS